MRRLNNAIAVSLGVVGGALLVAVLFRAPSAGAIAVPAVVIFWVRLLWLLTFGVVFLSQKP